MSNEAHIKRHVDPPRPISPETRGWWKRELIGAIVLAGAFEALLGLAWLAGIAAVLWFLVGWVKARLDLSERLRRRAVSIPAGLFQGPSFFWATFAGTLGKATHETGLVKWSALGLTLALVFGLLTLFADRIGARRLTLFVCATTLAGAALIAIGGRNLNVPALPRVVVAGTFLQFGATRAGVLVSNLETAGMGSQSQLTNTTALRRGFELGIFVPAFFLGWIAHSVGWAAMYGILTVLYAVALRTLGIALKKPTPAGARAASTPETGDRPSLAEGLRAGLRDRMLWINSSAAFAAQLAVFGTAQGLALVMKHHGVDPTIISILQGSAVIAFVFVNRPKNLGVDRFGRFVPLVGIVAVVSATVTVMWLLRSQLSSTAVVGFVVVAVALIAAEVLKQQGQTMSQIQARRYAPPQHNYAFQGLWLAPANLGAITGAAGAAELAPDHPIRWLLLIVAAALANLAITTLWYRADGRHRRKAAHSGLCREI